MKIERMNKRTEKVKFVSLKECIEHTEGPGYFPTGTIRKKLEENYGIYTPRYIYNKAEDQNCNCSSPLIYSALTTECLRCGGNV